MLAVRDLTGALAEAAAGVSGQEALRAISDAYCVDGLDTAFRRLGANDLP